MRLGHSLVVEHMFSMPTALNSVPAHACAHTRYPISEAEIDLFHFIPKGRVKASDFEFYVRKNSVTI